MEILSKKDIIIGKYFEHFSWSHLDQCSTSRQVVFAYDCHTVDQIEWKEPSILLASKNLSFELNDTSSFCILYSTWKYNQQPLLIFKFLLMDELYDFF
jgi:hypothetical protein